MSGIETVGLVGAGVIGAGWATRMLARGLRVVAWDPDPDSGVRLRASVDRAWPLMEEVGLFPEASREKLVWVKHLEEAVEAADFVQESAPERIELKTRLHAEIDALAPRGVPIASSTSGLLPSEFQSECLHPERVLVGHPFNPVYLLPLVEVLGGEQTAESVLESATDFYTDLGMKPLRVRKEIPGFLADRLQEALWREILHLVNEGVATPAELDAAISYGPGLRWALAGTCFHFHLAGGAGGIRQMLEHFDPALFPWARFDAPNLDKELVDRMVEGCAELTEGKSIEELEQKRDRELLGVLESLLEDDQGAGRLLARYRQRIIEEEKG